MTARLKLGRKPLAFGQVLAVYCWLANLQKTDSRMSVYYLCAVLGLLAMCSNYGKTIVVTRRQNICISIFADLFSFSTLLANYALFEPVTAVLNLFNGSCSFLGGFAIGYNVLLWMMNRLPLEADVPNRLKPGRVFALVFGSVAVIDLLYLYFVLYPGVLTRDSFSTVAQIMGDGAYNNTMPFWHTVTVQPFIRLGLAVFGDANAAVALFHSVQILFMAACFASVVVTLYQLGLPTAVLLAVYAVYVFIPYNIVYSVTLWKDVPFSGAAVLFAVGFYRLLKKIGRHSWINYVTFLVGALGFSLWRTNGWYAFAVTVIVMLLILGKKQKKLLIIMCAVLILCWVLINPVLDALGVSGTNMVEAFAVPMQQIARVVAQERPLTEEETELLSEIFWLDKIPQLYDPQTVDPVKFETFRYDKVEYITDNLGQYLKLYLSLGAKYPGDYLKAWIEETKGYWNGGYEFWVYTLNMGGAGYGIARSGGDNTIASLFASAFRLMNEPEAMKVFSSVGLYVWGLIGCCVINVLKKREEFLLTIAPLVLVVGLWLGTPVFCEFRYAYPVVLTMPLILGVTLFRRKE